MRLQSNMWWLYHCAPEIPKQHILEDSGACNISFSVEGCWGARFGLQTCLSSVGQASLAGYSQWCYRTLWRTLSSEEIQICLFAVDPFTRLSLWLYAGVWSSPRSRTAQFWFSSLANLRETNIICSSAVTYWHAITIQSSYRHFLCRYWSWYISSHLAPSLHCLDMRTRRSIVSCSCRSEQPVVEPNPEPGATLWKHWPFEGSMNRKSHGDFFSCILPFKNGRKTA